jgi:RTX calcium-binding nonapeptide repeat (4 copies)
MATPTPIPPQLNQLLAGYGFTDLVQAQLVQDSGNSIFILQKLAALITQQPPGLLQDMFNAFKTANPPGTIVLAAANAGIKSHFDITTGQATIYLGLNELKDVLTGSNAAVNLADVLAHELGHMTMASGHPGTMVIPNPTQAIIQGIQNEGAAALAQYVVTEQLGLSSASGDNQSKTLITILNNFFQFENVDPKSITTLEQLQAFSWFSTAETIAGAVYDTFKPSSSTNLNYTALWVDQWLLTQAKAGVGLVNAQIDWTKVNLDSISAPGDSVSGWTFTANNIPLLDSSTIPNVLYSSVAGETFSLTGSETAGNVVSISSETWVNNGVASVLGGTLGGSSPLSAETLVGAASTSNFYLDLSGLTLKPGSASVLIISNWSGSGGLYTFTDIDNFAGTATQIDNSAPMVATGLDTWKNAAHNGETLQFQPGFGDSPIGDLIITNFDGITGASVTLQNFNLVQAEAGGSSNFLGIQLQQSVALNSTAAPSGSLLASNHGSNESLTLSVDAASNSAETFMVTLSGAISSDFEVLTAAGYETIGGNDTFSITLAAGQTSTAFELVDVAPNDGTSDIASGATVTVTASRSSSGDSGAVAAAAIGSTSFSVAPGTVDTTTAPTPGDVITGVFNNSTSITTYMGDGGDDLIVGTGAQNFINAANSNNDVITGGTGANTIIGSAGNDIVNLQGSHDVVSLGGGFSTVNGGSGLDTIYGGSGNAIIVGNGGTDLIFGGGGTNQIYAGVQVTLAQAIAQTQAAAATSGKGDLIGVLDGNNTVIGGTGNDYINAGSGNDVIVLGSMASARSRHSSASSSRPSFS